MPTQVTVKERPIPFTAESVRGILAGTKTQTRRVIKWKPYTPGSNLNLNFSGLEAGYYCTGLPTSGWVLRSRGAGACWNDRTKRLFCRYGVPGDRLWVREPFGWLTGNGRRLIYRADGDPPPQPNYPGEFVEGMKWGSPRFFPRRYARLTLEVADVRVQRLQAITPDDATAEGIPQTAGEAHVLGLIDIAREAGHEWDNRTSVENYARLWDQINGKRLGCRWEDNPWVFAVTFKRAP
jgi:hypothetical protein